MCPACIATVALIAAGAVSTGGLTALMAKKLRAKGAAFKIQGGQNESIKLSGE